MLTILDGSTFCISDDRGDVAETTSGLFAHDTRFLSRLALTVGGARPLLLSSGRIGHFNAAFYLRNAPVDGIPKDAVSIARRRFIGTGLQERIELRNETAESLRFDLRFDVAADFTDIISVKLHDFSLGDPEHAEELPPPAPAEYDDAAHVLTITDPRGDISTRLGLSQPASFDDGFLTFDVSLGPHEDWHVSVDVMPSLDTESEDELGSLDAERESAGEAVVAWTLRVPRARGAWDAIRRAFDRSIDDLAALRMRAGQYRRPVFAAGMPWFMTVFGRDTCITSLQTMVLGHELAVGALDALADLQADEVVPEIDAEPGKIVHEVRHGRCAEKWFPRYYGSIDSTPLFLVLLAETWRWTDDPALVRRLEEPARRALEWIDRWGDRDGDGFVEYGRRSGHGLENQSWKDSGDSQRFRDGRVAEAPIAPVEVQGYVYDAKLGIAGIAREVWRDPALADRLEREAYELRKRFDEAFWIDEAGGYYALALDGEKQKVDAPCSNIGHVLWSGIALPERVRPTVDALLSADLWSGWGIRTMSSGSAAYNPISYHNGTVWPHDSAFTVWGLARNGYVTEARRIARALFEAAANFGWSLPEVFAGYSREDAPFPIAYPTPAKPQAWAAGTPVLLVRLLLGIEPDREHHRLVSTVEDELPSWLDGFRLEGMRAYGQMWTAAVERGRVTVNESV